MKRFRCSRSSESLLTSIPMSSSSSSPRDEVGLGPAEEFEAMLDRLDEEGKMSEKKRRPSLSQVKALEKHFEADKKLEPDRKAKIAAEIGMQPRQVAIWFQNRRARCKNKQLEMEYEVLKMSYEELKLSCENFEREKTALKTELRDLKMKVGESGFSESEKNVSDQRISTSGESESNNMYNVVAPTRQSVLHYNNQTSSSSCLLQFDSSSWNLQQGLNWFSRVYGAAGDEAPADPSRLALEQFDY